MTLGAKTNPPLGALALAGAPVRSIGGAVLGTCPPILLLTMSMALAMDGQHTPMMGFALRAT